MSEHDEQVAVVKWFKLQYPKYKDCILSIPNGSTIEGGAKGFGRYKWLVAEGFKPGVSDLFIAVPTKKFAGFWLEMKDKNKTEKSLTDNQTNFLATMLLVGYETRWAAGFDNAKDYIKDYMSDIHKARK